MAGEVEFKVILFDLGGVLLRLKDPVEIFGLDNDAIGFKERWINSPSVREFESGNIDTDEFAQRIVGEADLPYDWREFIRRFDSWPDRLFDQTIDVLQSIPARYDKALLSNINTLHWRREEIEGAISPFIDRAFLSFQTGFVKPDREAYLQVSRAYGCAPGEILFFDDTPSSVAAAVKHGLQGELVDGIESVRRSLLARDIIA